MSVEKVHELIEQIQGLSPGERLLFDDLLAEHEEREWRQGAGELRRIARAKGIDQQAVDRAVARVRYGGK